MTNYEKIKAMSVEEFIEFTGNSTMDFADIFISIIRCSKCPKKRKCEAGRTCYEKIKEYLESEVEEDG